jgi:hypothetical protein
MTHTALPRLSDRDLLTQLKEAVHQERQSTVQVIALLMEVDARKLYAQQSCSSLFTYCVQMLHFSEHAAYLRIEAARAARRFPAILDRLADGTLHLTAVSLLAPHLTPANHANLLDEARHKSKREVEQIIARVRPQPDVPAVIRKLPTLQPTLSVQTPVTTRRAFESTPSLVASPASEPGVTSAPLTGTVAAPSVRPSVITPLAPERFKVQFTVDRATYDKLRQAQDLLRHTVPMGDPAVIFDRALTLLIAELSKTKIGETPHPRAGRAASPDSRSRHIPAAVRREVWRRDGGQCAFRGEQGRCKETGWLEFHHVRAYRKGGAATVETVELRCKVHNLYKAEQEFGSTAVFHARDVRAVYDSYSVQTERVRRRRESPTSPSAGTNPVILRSGVLAPHAEVVGLDGWCGSAQSCRSVAIGSRAAARNAGTDMATAQDVTITSRLAAYASGSKTWTPSGISAARGVAIRAIASATAMPPPATRPMQIGWSDCDNTSLATSLAVAPIAMRTPISFARCSTTYDRTLNRPDTVSTSASPASTTATQNAICSAYAGIPVSARRVMTLNRAGSMLERRSSST